MRTRCSSTSRTPSRPMPERGTRGRRRALAGATGEPRRSPFASTGSPPRGGAVIWRSSSPVPPAGSIPSSFRRWRAAATWTRSRECSPSWRPSFGLKRPISLQAQIESPKGLIEVERIAGSSARLETLVFGPGDYAASLGIGQRFISEIAGYPGDQWHYARSRIAAAAHRLRPPADRRPYAALVETVCGSRPGARRMPVSRKVGHSPRPDRDRERGLLPPKRSSLTPFESSTRSPRPTTGDRESASSAARWSTSVAQARGRVVRRAQAARKDVA